MADPQAELQAYQRPGLSRAGGRFALVQATGVVAGLTVVSKVFGFVREAALAAGFGATAATDAYLVAFTIPTMLFAAGAALGLAFIPVFAEVYEKEGPVPAYRTACTVLNVTFLLGCLVLAVGWLSTPLLVRVAAPGFGGEVYHLAVRLTRYMFPMMLFQALNGLFAGMLQTQGNFAVPAAVGILFNVVIIFSIVALGPVFGIEVVALGTTIAVAVQALAQLVALWRRGFRWLPRIAWGDPRLKRWGALAVPVIVTSGASQAGVLVERMLASGLVEGSISALNYAQKLVALPQGVIGTAIAVVLFPTLSRYAGGEDREGFRDALSDGLRVTLFLLVPVTVLTMVLREPIVRLAFQRGEFDWVAVEATSYALLFLALGIVVLSVGEVLTRAFYARQEMVPVVLVTMVSVPIAIALKFLLVAPLGHGGLALALPLGGGVGVVSLFFLMTSRLGKQFRQNILKNLWKIILASVPMALLVLLTAKGIVSCEGVVGQVLSLAGPAVVGMLLYVALLVLLRVPEACVVRSFMGRVSRRILSLRSHARF